MIDLLWLDGTWTRPGRRSAPSEALRRAVDGSRVRFTYVDYPGQFGPATGVGDLSPAESVSAGMVALTHGVEASLNRVVVGGYSQGAMAAIAFAREILAQRPDLVVDAVATMGDPHNPVHVGRAGIAGPLSVPRRRFTVHVPGDPIADLPLGSPLRSVADLTEWISIRSPEAGIRWATEAYETLDRQRAQAWWAPWRWHDIESAGRYVLGYLGTKHTTDYVTGGHAVRLARMIGGVA
ncbi:PE-PPE domain-containing protein [Gordonia sp. OPL2]|uniref:PE-PPE domain-containing protein n=1 Tax=Gordonia sp. OPL2 TaxID=2486274 RepID=UPI001654C8D8|nr:PE-PPE domain-containing protein [Gordonia sp. OPL2]ROZ89024.1 PE-PPE domain-containing protein [Gordonia sp. OPL2]